MPPHPKARRCDLPAATQLPARKLGIGCRKEKLILRAGDNRGYIYGLLAISRRLLGVTDFWFWNDQQFSPVEEIPVPADFSLGSRPAAVKWRGWFVNDEVLLHRWQLDGSREKPWEMVFEALLRCGGNMVIPGTGENALRYRGLAQRMGLAVTHHHAEPLGARMFGEAYPDLEPRYDQYPAEFEALWAEALEEQGNDVVWNLGFRGQGDRPFWADDPRYDTQRSRGQLISAVIRRQYEMVQQRYPGAACATNLYGEIMELYRAGCLQLPAGVIKIWADNGYGAMVSRRQGNHDPRVPALPAPEDEGPHGIYYHASFYDLQAANHITMLPTSLSFVERELERVRHSGANDYWIINCSNVKPHVFTLAYIARIWQEGTVPAETFLTDYTCLYYGAQAQQAAGYFAGIMPRPFISVLTRTTWRAISLPITPPACLSADTCGVAQNRNMNWTGRHLLPRWKSRPGGTGIYAGRPCSAMVSRNQQRPRCWPTVCCCRWKFTVAAMPARCWRLRPFWMGCMENTRQPS